MSSELLARLWQASWQGTLLIATVWVVCRALPSLSPKVRYWLWWLVCVKLVVALAGFAIPVPSGAPNSFPRTLASFDPLPPVTQVIHSSALTSQATAPDVTPVWPLILAALWMAGLVLGVVRLSAEAFKLRRLIKSARKLETEPAAQEVRRLGVELGFSSPPQLLESELATSPFVTGILRTKLILPKDFERQIDPDQLRMALAHELAHLRRKDLLLGVVPTLARLLFFFLPPLWLACSEWATEREAACDKDALLATKATPADYGDLLLKIVSQDHRGALAPCLGATASYHTLKRRLSLMNSYAVRQSGVLRFAGIAALVLTSACVFSWKPAGQTTPAGKNLLKNGSFETDSSGWKQGDDIFGVRYGWSKSVSHTGDGSLLISKSAASFYPVAEWSQTFDREGKDPAVRVSAWVRAKNVSKAIVDVQFWDVGGKLLGHKWAAFIGAQKASDPTESHDFQEYKGVVPIPAKTTKITVALQDYGPGTVWFDDVTAQYTAAPIELEADSKINAVTNGDFEHGLDGWFKGSLPLGADTPVEISVVDGGHNGRALRLFKTENTYFPVAMLLQAVPFTSGPSKVHIGAWVKADNARKATVPIYFDGAPEDQGKTWGIFIGTKDASSSVNHDWKLYENVLPIPSGTSGIRIGIEMYGPGTVLIDDLKVTFE